MSQSEEDLIRQVRMADIVLQTAVTLVNLSGRRLTVEEEKDLDEVKLGIDATRALLPLLPEEDAKPVRDAIAQLQMAYVRETQAEPAASGEPAREGEPAPEAPKGEASDPERAKARAKIWTPPGSG